MVDLKEDVAKMNSRVLKIESMFQEWEIAVKPIAKQKRQRSNP